MKLVLQIHMLSNVVCVASGCEGISSESYDNFASVTNVSYYCEAKCCHSCIKQLIHNYYTSIEKQVDIPSFKSLQVEQEKLQQLVSDMSAKLEGLSSSKLMMSCIIKLTQLLS